MMTTIPVTNFILKPPRLIIENQFQPPLSSDLDEQPSFKYLDYKKAFELSTPYVRRIISSANLIGGFQNILVDVKVQEVRKNSFPCLPGWHLDCTPDPFHSTRPEIHHFFIYGADCYTEFLCGELELSFYDRNFQEVYQREMELQNPLTIQIPELHMIQYSRLNLHRPTRANKTGIRLLIRITETDLIKPKPYHQKLK